MGYGPKRFVDKEIRNYTLTATNSQTNAIVWTADTPCTIVRQIFNGSVRCASNANAVWVMAYLGLGHGAAPLSLNHLAETTNQQKDVLWSHFSNLDVGEWYPMFFDVKGQRKMLTGDTIVLSALSSVASSHVLAGTLTTFCKIA